MEAHFDFSDQVVLVTGAGQGIGSGIAKEFAEAGAKVAVHYHTSRESAEKLVEQIQAGGGTALGVQADLTSGEAVERLFEQVQAGLGPVDVLVNNAGIYPVTPLLEMPEAEWEATIDANLRSVFLCTQAAARPMVARGHGGAIVNIASIEAGTTAPGHSHYGPAKAAVVMLTRSAAYELGPYRIRVNAVSPGLIWREGIEQGYPRGVEAYTRLAPLGRLGAFRDVANACLFLASPLASWITGINLVVDGGISATPAY